MNRNDYIWHIYTHMQPMVLEYGIQHFPLSKITVSHFFQYTSTMGNAYGTQVCFWMTCSVYGIAAGKLVLSLVNFVVLMRGNMSPNRNIAKIH